MNKFMRLAVDQAKIAFDLGEVPIGAVIVCDNKVIASAYNRKNIDCVSIYHAEILAIIDACTNLNTWHLDNCELYVTLKPCEMCLNAIAESRIKTVYYLLDSNYCNNLKTNYNNISLKSVDCDVNYSNIFKSFFNDMRNDVSRET